MPKKLTKKQAAAHYRELVDRYGMTQVGMGRFLGSSPRQSRRYAAGDTQLPQTADLLFALMQANKLTPEQVFKIGGLKVPPEGFTDQRVRDE